MTLLGHERLRGGAIDVPIGMQFVPISSLSVGIGEDAQVILSAAWRRTVRGTFITNCPENACITAPRGSSRWAAVFARTENTERRADGQRHRPRPPYVSFRAFTSFLALGEYSTVRPTYSPAGGLMVHELPSTACYVEFKPVTPGDATDGDTSIESMKITEDTGVTANRGMFLELAGFVIDDGAYFDVVTCPPFRLTTLGHGDSNACGGYVHPTAGGQSFTLTQHRSGVVNQGVSAQAYDPRGSTLQYPTLLMQEYCNTRGFHRDAIENSHGGKWQGVMGPLTRAKIGTDIWTNPYPDVYSSLARAFIDDVEWNNPAHWSGGGARPRVGWYGSVENDAFQRVLEILGSFGVGDEGYFGGATFQAAVKATLDLWTTTFPDCKVIAHTGSLNDATFDPLNLDPALDTFARFVAACTSGGGTGRGFSTPTTVGAEDAIGFLFRVSDYNNVTGISSAITAELHYDEAECIAIRDAVKTALFAWLDRALGVMFVDGTNGNDANAGTLAAPKKTFAGAGSSWTFLSIAAGTYAEKLTLGASGTSGAPKTVYARGGTVTIDGGGVRDGIDLGGRSHVLVQNITVTNAVIGAKVSSGSNVRLKHLVIENCGTGVKATAGSGTFEFVDASSCTIAFEIAGAATITTRRCRWHDSDVGVKASGGTLTDDGSHVFENEENQVWNAGGTLTFRNGKHAIGTTTTAFSACHYVESGTTTIENCLVWNGNADPLVPTYAIRAVSAGRIAWRNLTFGHDSNDFAVYVWVDAVGASGNIVEARNNVYLDEGQTARWSYGATIGEGIANARAFSPWQALTDRSGALLERFSEFGEIDLQTTAATAIADDRPGAASIARGAGMDLSGSFTRDYLKRTRTTWDTGPLVLD